MADDISDERLLSVLSVANSWWRTGSVQPQFLKSFKRNAYYTATRDFYSNIRRIVVLSGLRRTGKTTIVYQMIDDLLSRGIDPHHILFFSYDSVPIRQSGFERVFELYRKTICADDEFYMFVDEIQFETEWALQLKSSYDMYPGMKALVTGSASSVLEKRVSESGAGRWSIVKVPTLSFYEYCEMLGIEKSSAVNGLDVFGFHKLSLQDQTHVILGLSDLSIHMMRYLQVGGFPELINVSDVLYARRKLSEDVIDRVVGIDLPMIYGIRSRSALDQLLSYFARCGSTVLNTSMISSQMGIARDTVEHYISYLESGNLVVICKQLDLTGKKSLKSMDKAYLTDNSIRCALYPDIDIYTDETEYGYAIETAAFNHVKSYFTLKSEAYNVGYIRGAGGSEVDIAVQYRGQYSQLIESKMRNHSAIKDTSGIVIYALEGTPGYVLTKSGTDFGLTERDSTSLYRIPATVFLYLTGMKTS
ncbi:MAG: ATP-binding protein [Clostridia bacterium]|nr:ATP-binding protein [Clostridia bacterium]